MTSMRNVYLLLAMFTFVSYTATAQNDPNAKKVLDGVSAKLKTFKGVSALFNYVSKTRAGKTASNVNGNVLIKDQKYYIKQGSTEIFSDGNKVWNYNGAGEVTITPADDAKAITPQKLLTNFYDKDFVYKLISSAGTFHEIELTPVDKRKNFQKVNLFVDKAKMMVTKARILDKSNNTIEFALKNINTSANIPDASFVFNKSKYKREIEVIE
ncbi:outer membrane lipoprotein carrier protein LolA [Segetibacter sp. 3557_3]|uniref:LolA family protein n=1 Tax=Segetibacter sp. 3557_3 TaxID=2547429 RepID=UPI0010586CA8|nr:outer membrane lipoprotein carrier protein LolA [Segetibacter sp. 3557_3]TDH25666.1 outer membrane lipoprotein carrier protein LolA [Segetibacter sp. 3557_3]